MRKMVLLSSLFLAMAIPAMAQEENSKADVAFGYQYIRFNVSGNFTGVPGSSFSKGFNINGGNGSIALNLNRTFGIVADIGGATTSQTATIFGAPVSGSATLFTYLFGPRLSSRGKTWTPYAQALFGGARASGSITGGPSGSKNVFAYTVGGGLDANISQHVAIRLIQAEYFFTNFTAASTGPGTLVLNHQNNVRITAGIVFRLGGR